MQMCIKNSRFLTNIWSITAECSRLMTEKNKGYRAWTDDGVGAVNYVHSWMARPRMSGQLYMTQVTEVKSKTNCPKCHFASPLFGDPLKISPPKVDKPTYRTELYENANFHADRREISVPGQKIHIFIGDSPGGYSPMLFVFGKLSSSQCYATFDMRVTVYEIFAVKVSKFVFLGPFIEVPQGETLCPRDPTTTKMLI